MLLKNEIAGVRCAFSDCQKDVHEGEVLIEIGARKVIIKINNIALVEPVEKFAVIGEKPCYLKSSGIIEIAGPTASNDFLLKINSRGYSEEFFVNEEDVIFRK